MSTKTNKAIQISKEQEELQELRALVQKKTQVISDLAEELVRAHDENIKLHEEIALLRARDPRGAH